MGHYLCTTLSDPDTQTTVHHHNFRGDILLDDIRIGHRRWGR